MQFIILSLAVISASALRYGGNGGGYSYLGCSSGNYVEAVQVRRGARLDRLRIRCTNENWSEWLGGHGGGYGSFYSKANGFCGMSGRHGARIDRLCLYSVDGQGRCFGGSGGGAFTDRYCSDAPGNSRARLTGFHVRSGSEIDGLTPTWNDNIVCPHYLQVSNSRYYSGYNGFYSFHSFYKGHYLYKHNVHNSCIYYSDKAWRFHPTCRMGYWMMKLDASSHYDICPSGLGGQSGWYFFQQGYVLPTLQLQGYDSLPLQWGNAVGYWAQVSSGSGSSGGATRTWTSSVTDTSSTSRTYSTTEEESFSQMESSTNTWGVELGISNEFDWKFGTATASMKWSYTHSITSGTSQTTSHATTNALTNARSTSNTNSQSCQSEAPTFGGRWGIGNTPWTLYAWEVYRASSIENVGATQTTCEFQYQTGPCRFVPPNCPLGTCLDEHCVQCIAGVEPFKSLSELQDEYPGCLDSLEIEADAPRCSISKYDWSCCSTASPCGLHQGDCDADSHCAGELVCDHHFCRDNPDCPHSSFDVCVSPDRRELSQSYYEEDDPSKEASDEYSDNLFSHQKSRLLKGEKEVPSVPTDLDEASNADDLREEEWDQEPISGCIQFDDEGHCTTGPLYKYCRWEAEQCVNKENIKDKDVPEGDFTYVYNGFK